MLILLSVLLFPAALRLSLALPVVSLGSDDDDVRAEIQQDASFFGGGEQL